MKKFIADYPIFSILLASCLGIIFFVSFVTYILIAGGIKMSKSLANSQSFKSGFSKTEEPYEYAFGKKDSKNKFLEIPINGVIYTEQSNENGFNSWNDMGTYGYSVKKELLEAAKDPNIKGVILEIDSPGGTISGANAILEGVEQYKNLTKKPVYAHVLGMAASGGYMAALPADKIYAEEGSLVGSIGVIMGPFKYYDKVTSEGSFLGSVTTENGIESFHITAGTDKDLGDPYKKLSENAKKTLQQGVDNEYQNFVGKVVNFRGIEKDIITGTLGALVFDNKTAEQYKLIDGTRSKDSLYEELSTSLKLPKDDFQVVSSKKTDFWKSLFDISGANKNIKPTESTTCALCGKMLFLYGAPEMYAK